MNSDIEEFLEHVDQWKFKLHERLKRMTPARRKAFWKQIREEARARGLHVVEPEKPAKRPPKRTDELAKLVRHAKDLSMPLYVRSKLFQNK